MNSLLSRGYRRLKRELKGRFAACGLILMYHRIAEVGFDPWGLCVSPRHFAEHLEVLSQRNSIVPLQDMVQAVEDGKLPRQVVSVTFDDGYADNFHNASPLLERFHIPATVFVATGGLADKRGFWWDELSRLVLETEILPETLDVTIHDHTYSWTLGTAAHFHQDEHLQYRSWRAWEKAPTARHTLYLTLYERLFKLSPPERDQVLQELATSAGLHQATHTAGFRLSIDEISALARTGRFEIGAHTVTHPSLPLLGIAAQREEIRQSRIDLEEIVGRPVISFAFPHGRFTEETVSLAREVRFTCACTTIADLVRRTSDCFRLPRMQVSDWSGETFAQKLSSWFSRV